MRYGMMAAALALAATVSAGAGERVFEVRGLGGAGGMYLPTCSPENPDLMFISCDMSGTYRSLDGGKTWELIHYQQIRSTRNSARPLFVGKSIYWNQGGTLKVSKDEGATWAVAVKDPPWGRQNITHLAAPGGGKALLVGTAKGIWRSAGKDWKSVQSGKTNALILLGDKVYAALGANLMQSEDAGASWSKVEVPAANGKALLDLTGGADKGKTVLFAIAQGVGIVRSEDAGATWTPADKWRSQRYLGMAANQTKLAYAVAGRKDLLRTTDGGASWESCFHMTGKDKNVEVSWVQTQLKWGYYITDHGFGASLTDPKLVMLSTQGDFYISRDGGRTWKQKMNEILGVLPGDTAVRYKCTGLEVTSCWGYLFDPWKKNREYIAYTDIGFGRTVDNGKTWSWSGKGSPWVNTFYDVCFDPEIVGRMYAACSNRHDIPHWTHITPNDPSSRHHIGGVCISDDHAATWRKSSQGLPHKPCTTITLDPTSPKEARVLYAGVFGEGAYKSEDGGKTWVKKSNGLGNPGNMHVYRIRRHPESGNLYCLITAIRKGNRSFPVPGGLWKSEDGAETWTDITASAKLYWPTNFAFLDDDENTIYITASTIPGNAQGGIYKTTDGGKSWQHVLKDADLAKSGGSGYDHMMSVTIHPDDSDLVYVGSNAHGLWFTKNAGKDWTHYQAFPFANAQSINVHPRDHEKIYVTTFGGGVWVGPHLPPK